MKNYKEYKVGQRVVYSWNEFDGKGSENGTVIGYDDDNDVIVKTDSGLTLLIFDESEYMFERK